MLDIVQKDVHFYFDSIETWIKMESAWDPKLKVLVLIKNIQGKK